MENNKINDLLFRYFNAVYNQNTIDIETKSYIFSFLKKFNLEFAKSHRGITLTSQDL